MGDKEFNNKQLNMKQRTSFDRGKYHHRELSWLIRAIMFPYRFQHWLITFFFLFGRAFLLCFFSLLQSYNLWYLLFHITQSFSTHLVTKCVFSSCRLSLVFDTIKAPRFPPPFHIIVILHKAPGPHPQPPIYKPQNASPPHYCHTT